MPNVLQVSVPDTKCPAVFKAKYGTFLTVDTNILTLVENVCSSRTAINWPVTGRKVCRLVMVECGLRLKGGDWRYEEELISKRAECVNLSVVVVVVVVESFKLSCHFHCLMS
jgi:hypothetical protein